MYFYFYYVALYIVRMYCWILLFLPILIFLWLWTEHYVNSRKLTWDCYLSINILFHIYVVNLCWCAVLERYTVRTVCFNKMIACPAAKRYIVSVKPDESWVNLPVSCQEIYLSNVRLHILSVALSFRRLTWVSLLHENIRRPALLHQMPYTLPSAS